MWSTSCPRPDHLGGDQRRGGRGARTVDRSTGPASWSAQTAECLAHGSEAPSSAAEGNRRRPRRAIGTSATETGPSTIRIANDYLRWFESTSSCTVDTRSVSPTRFALGSFGHSPAAADELFVPFIEKATSTAATATTTSDHAPGSSSGDAVSDGTWVVTSCSGCSSGRLCIRRRPDRVHRSRHPPRNALAVSILPCVLSGVFFGGVFPLSGQMARHEAVERAPTSRPRRRPSYRSQGSGRRCSNQPAVMAVAASRAANHQTRLSASTRSTGQARPAQWVADHEQHGGLQVGNVTAAEDRAP